jgi:hypothetical protein
MNIQKISVQDIIVQDSRFSCSDALFTNDQFENSLLRSFETTGIMNPVCVLKDRNSTYLLVDGKKRLEFAQDNNISNIDAVVLSKSTPPEELINIIYSNKKNEILESVINRIQFICCALSSGAPEQWVLETLCQPFGFRPHSGFLRECQTINKLPREVKLFFHEKKFSLKQILNLSCLPEDLIDQIISWKSTLQITASILEELASNIRDYVKMKGMTLQEFLNDTDVKELLGSELSSRNKTEELRRIIRLKRFPVLSDANARIQKAVEEMNLPEGVIINWDRTLENRNIEFVININDPASWDSTMQSLNKSDIKKKIKNILDEL